MKKWKRGAYSGSDINIWRNKFVTKVLFSRTTIVILFVMVTDVCFYVCEIW